MYQGFATKVLTGEVRLSYVNLTEARASQQGGEPKFSATLLIPKSDVATYQDLKAAEEAAAQDAVGKMWNGTRPPVLESVIWDGDGVRKNGTPFGPECKGHWVMTASSKNKPGVVHQSNIKVELAPQDVYGGMYARVTVNFFGYLNSGKKGVGCGLGNVMKTREGEHLSGGASAASDFAGLEAVTASAAVPGYSVTPAYQAPTYPPAQPQYAPPAYGGLPIGASPVNPLSGLPW